MDLSDRTKPGARSSARPGATPILSPLGEHESRRCDPATALALDGGTRHRGRRRSRGFSIEGTGRAHLRRDRSGLRHDTRRGAFAAAPDQACTSKAIDMNELSTDIISAFFDHEPVDADRLAAALEDPANRALLVGFVRLRQEVAGPAGPLPESLATLRSRPVARVAVVRWLAAAARCSCWCFSPDGCLRDRSRRQTARPNLLHHSPRALKILSPALTGRFCADRQSVSKEKHICVDSHW